MLAFYLSMIETEQDRSKFEKIYIEYSSLMKYIANGILHDNQLAEDACQDAFMKIIDSLHKLDEIYCHKTKRFLVIVVENVSKTLYNKQKKNNKDISLDELDYEIPGEKLVDEEVLSNIGEMEILAQIELLPDIYRDVLFLKYLDGYKDKEISKLLDISGANVRKRLERAKCQLGALLSEEIKENV